MRSFLDTNILVYAVDRADAAKHERARQILMGIGRGDEEYVLSTQVMLEFYVVVTRRLDPPMSATDAQRALRQLMAVTVVTPSPQMVIEATELAEHHQLSIWDALIIRAARAAVCDRVLTEDLAHGRTITGIQIHDPFAA